MIETTYLRQGMKQPLRITFEGKDYTFNILNNSLDRDTSEFRIQLGGQEYILERNQKNEWLCSDITIGDNAALLTAIGRNIGLRFKL